MRPHPIRNDRGTYSLLAVTGIGLTMLISLSLAYRQSLHSVDNQARAQIKIDYSQKEEALLRALLHVLPNKAIGAMQQGSNLNAGNYSWESVFREATELANSEKAIDVSMLTMLGGGNPILANTGDAVITNLSSLVSPIHDSGGFLNSGNVKDSTLLFDSKFSDSLPAPLQSAAGECEIEKNYPIISLGKTHASGWGKGLLLSPDDYPLYNLYSYPDLRFGLLKPGSPFVAKRNWWAFKLEFGSNVSTAFGGLSREKYYVVSIYEVPSQLPLSASATMSIGRHVDGTDWKNVRVRGGVFSEQLVTEGAFALESGVFSARRNTLFDGSPSVDGRLVTNNFDDFGVRESREASRGVKDYDASMAGNVGRAAFIPINPGREFLNLKSDGPESERLSTTSWNHYSRGANRCATRVQITEMLSVDQQSPVAFRFHYLDTSGNNAFRDFRLGENWPVEGESGWASFPFESKSLSWGRPALHVHLDRFPGFLAGIGDAADIGKNSSIYLSPDSSASTVVEPSHPSLDTDLAIVLKGGEDMTAYSNGFSLVTNLRLYMGASLNTIPVNPPAGSGIDESSEYYPPVSVFSSEKRFGIIQEGHDPIVSLTGQLSSLKTNDDDVYRPLEFRNSSDLLINHNRITADLKALKSPAELPPIHFINWLITIEEIRPR